MMDQLRSCPFCGWEMEPTVMCFDKQKGRINPDTIRVHCYRCGAMGGSAWTKTEAATNWNRRKELTNDN